MSLKVIEKGTIRLRMISYSKFVPKTDSQPRCRSKYALCISVSRSKNEGVH